MTSKPSPFAPDTPPPANRTYSTPDGNPDADNPQKMKISVSRFGTPDEVADAAVFLAKNKYANNCILNLDGGLSAT